METIRERISVADARQRSYIEWQTKILAGFISSTVQSEKGMHELHKAAMSLSMFSESENSEPDSSESGKPGTMKPQVIEPRTGSFEKLSGFFRGGSSH